MQIDIRAQDFTLTEALRTHVEHRLRFAMTRFHDRMHRISVRMSDVNGPKGGVDKRCVVVIKARGLPDIVVADTEADLYVAIDRAVGRARRTLQRQRTRTDSVLNDPFPGGGDGER